MKEVCHNVHMKTISIRELHLKTGRWVRHAASRGPIVVTDRGRRPQSRRRDCLNALDTAEQITRAKAILTANGVADISSTGETSVGSKDHVTA